MTTPAGWNGFEQHLFALEQQLHRPEFRTDPARVSALLADDFREFGASGRIWSRSEIIEAMQHEASHEIEVRDLRCQILSPTLALLTYYSRSKAGNSTAPRESLRSSLWRLDPQGWRMIFHQGTPLPPRAS